VTTALTEPFHVLISLHGAGLRRFGRHEVAERLISAMTPLAAALPFASKCCSVGAELLAVYAGNTGFITSSSNGSDYAMQATAQSQQLAQLRQVKLHTLH
jgi:hypothetical protein